MILDISSMTILDKVQAPLSQSQISAIDSVVSGNYQSVGDYIIPTDIAIEYHDDTIWLSSKSYVTSVDCTDFIKDGMMSTVELCDTTLILNFNTDVGSDPISIELSNFVDNYDTKIHYLSNCISAKQDKQYNEQIYAIDFRDFHCKLSSTGENSSAKKKISGTVHGSTAKK